MSYPCKKFLRIFGFTVVGMFCGGSVLTGGEFRACKSRMLLLTVLTSMFVDTWVRPTGMTLVEGITEFDSVVWVVGILFLGKKGLVRLAGFSWLKICPHH